MQDRKRETADALQNVGGDSSRKRRAITHTFIIIALSGTVCKGKKSSAKRVFTGSYGILTNRPYRQARGARGAGGRIMSARKGAARRRKFKKWAFEVWSFAKGYLSFSKLLVYAVLYIDYKSTMTTLDLCRISVANNYTGSLPYLTALIAFLQAATATVLSFSLNKSKAENTTGGITYDTATKRDC